MSERTTNPIEAPLITRPGESREHVGTRNITSLLPHIFQTSVNKQFLETTLEQLMSSGSLAAINSYVGSRYLKRSAADTYVDDSRVADNYQFVPGAVNRDNDNNITQALSYDDMINGMEFNEVNVNQLNKLLNESGYTLDLPINYDMFINYHKYFWLVDILPPCDIVATVNDKISIDTIPGKIYYTTPTLDTNKTLELHNGMRIRFMPAQIDRIIQTVIGNTTFTASQVLDADFGTVKVYKNNQLQTLTTDYTISGAVVTFVTAPSVDDEVEIHKWYSYSLSDAYDCGGTYIVDGVGSETGIVLTEQFASGQIEGSYGTRGWFNHTVYSSQEPSGFDDPNGSFDFKPYDVREWRMVTRDYVVEQRFGEDQSAWARSNLWMHEDAALAVVNFLDLNQKEYVVDKFRGIRPIIEFKTGIEKYDFGKKHIAYVNHLIESTDDPATTIVGQIKYNHATQHITTVWDPFKGADDGDLVKVVMGSSTTFWECVEAHGNPKNPTYIENRRYWRQITGEYLEDGDYVLFLRSSNTAYKDKIFEVGGVTAGTGITLTEVLSSRQPEDKIVVMHGYNTRRWDDGEDTKPYSGSEWYWDGTAWIYGQQKMHRSAGMRVQLYDTTLAKLDNDEKYPSSTFAGDYIFNYGYNSASKFDDALGFNPRYVDYGNTPGLSFDFGSGATRYEYNLYDTDSDNSKVIEIPGFYYWYNTVTGRYYNGWSLVRGGQSVKRHIQKIVTDTSKPITVELGTTDFNLSREFIFSIRNDKLAVSQATTSRIDDVNGIMPTLFMSRNTNYDIITEFPQADIEFVDVDGNALVGVTRTAGTGDQFQLQIGATTHNVIKYRLTALPSVYGVIYLDNTTDTYNIKVHLNGTETNNWAVSNSILTIGSNLAVDDVYDITYYSDSELTSAEGNFLPADTHIYNAQNDVLTDASFGDMVEHIRHQMESIPGFTGSYFGSNNYDKLPHVHQFGGTIRQQPFSTELLAQLSLDTDTDAYNALKYSAQSYRRFKSQFALKARQLHNVLDMDTSVHELVDKILLDLNVGKNVQGNFANSNMAMYRDYVSENYSLTTTMTPVIDLPKSVNTYDDAENHIQVWIKEDDGLGNEIWRSLIKNEEYTLTPAQLTITRPIAYTSTNTALVHVRWYPQNAISYIPNSSVKLGLVRPFIPEYNSTVIIGHDGSEHTRIGTELYNRNAVGFDPVDAAIWDLELRIYNNLQSSADTVPTYQTIMPNAHRKTPTTWNDLTVSLEQEFNSWKVRNNITELKSNTYFNIADPFTYNYSDVGPGIGGWRGLYTYYFNTDRPHTHPWEMFGYNKKPTWWDANYSWTSPVERAALLVALQYGHVNDPSSSYKQYDRNFAYPQYDWQNDVLVTTAGVLNDPITANIVTTPADPNKDFVFGDWGPVEAQWKKTSEYKITQFVGLLRVRPLWFLNSYFKSNLRQLLDIYDLDNPQYMFKDTKLLGNNKQTNLSYSLYEDSIVESIKVLNSGSGYTSAPSLTIYNNFGSGATATAYIKNGEVFAVSVNAPGKEYYNKPTITASNGTAKFEAQLVNGARKYFAGVSNAIVEFSRFNNVDIANLQQRFENLEFNPMIKTGGFINSNQRFILESSQDKGSVVVPEESHNTILYTSKPIDEVFFGAIKFSKTDNGYKISGFDNSKQLFNYYKSNHGSRKILVQVDNTNVYRYTGFDNVVSTLNYNTEINNLQLIYEFILGYGEYLKSKGWVTNWRGVATSFITWATNEIVTTDLYLIPNNDIFQINEGKVGYFDTLTKRYDGVYNAIDQQGKQVLINKLLVNRTLSTTDEETVTEIKAKDETGLLYGLRMYKIAVEHAVVFDNKTQFDDTIYDPALGQLHRKIIWKGSRTKEWNGKLTAPGYLISNNDVIQNFDTTARELDQYYGRSNTLSNSQIADVARFNSGYNKPKWAENLKLDDDTAFEFIQGTKKYRGTRLAIDAFARNHNLFGNESTANVYEQWAVRTADYGDVRSRDTIEFELTEDLLTTSPQPVRFSVGEIVDVLTDITIDVDTNSPLLVTGTPGNNFTTRNPKTYSQTTLLEEKDFANDFITAGLPLTTEADYRVLNREDFTVFPVPAKSQYNFYGDWQNILQWDNKTSYKFNDKVLYQGRTWAMLDPDGSSGLQRPNDPILITGTISLPVIPAGGQTLIIDGNTVTLNKQAIATTQGVINVTGSNDLLSTDVVPHNTTLILGGTSGVAQTITLTNVVNTTVFNSIEKIGTVTNPTIQGSATAQLIIDGTAINFDDTVPTLTNITALDALENAFNASWLINNSTANVTSVATARLSALEALRSAYTNANTLAGWSTFLTNYFASSDAGLNVNFLLTEYGGGSVSYAAELATLITNDVDIINNSLNRTYVALDVISGAATITASDISSAQSATAQGQYITALKNFLVVNPTAGISVSTFITTTFGTTFQTYSSLDIRNKINAAGIPNITASLDSSRLKITKTTTTPSAAFSLTISAASSNAAVGFASATQTINSTTSIVTTTPNLSLLNVVNQINAAGITGITAQTNANNPSLLQINCNLSTLFIGAGTANSVIGLTTGIVPASTTTTTVSTSLDINDIVNSVNLANISGVSASNANNRLKITSTNSTLAIGAGTANATVGLTAQTYSATQTIISNVFNAIVGSDGNQVFREMDYDPNIFSIWVADNSEQGNFNQGYAVYQTMDFGMYCARACAGITRADDAEITVARYPSTLTQAHNLVVGDYVLIRGSTTVPNIDGIHRVTDVSLTDPTKFFIDEYIEQEGGTGNIYPLRNVRFSSYSALTNEMNSTINNVFKYNFQNYRQNDQQKPIYVFVDNDGNGVPAVYKWSGNWTDVAGNQNGHWIKVRSGVRQARNDLIENVKIYDAERRSTIVTIETWDPAKGIILGFLDNEIDFTLTADVATYNYNTIDGEIVTEKAWGSAQVGKRWWDLNTAVYLDYEQGSVDYQQNNWGRLFDGATVDVYEWTRSTVLPEQWEIAVDQGIVIDNKIASGEAYYVTVDGENIYNWCEESYYNPRSRKTETYYYFWVKNKINYAGNRVYNTYQLGRLLEDPKAFDITWAAGSGSDLLFIANIDKFVTKNSVVQVNTLYESNASPLNEWTMIADGDPDSIIPEFLHIKIRDSLAGFNNYKQRFSYSTWNATTVYSPETVVKEGNDYYVSLFNASQNGINLNKQPSLDTAMSYWTKIYDYELPPETQQDDIDVWRGQMIPDLNLHEYNRYGHLIRPRQSLYRDLVSARQNWTYTVNELLSEINLISEVTNWEPVFRTTFRNGNVTYDINPYWNLVDWRLVERDSADRITYSYDLSTVADETVDRFADFQNITERPIGTYILVKTVPSADGINRPEMYYWTANGPVLVWKSKATIALSEEIWNQSKFGHGFDASPFDILPWDSGSSNVISKLFDLLRKHIFIGRHKIKYNKLWFKCLYEAITQNTADDFAFKTTYVDLKVSHPLLLDKSNLEIYNIENLEQFFDYIKPFHTKIHKSLESTTYAEANEIDVEELNRTMDITMVYNRHCGRNWAGDTLLQGGDFTSTPAGNIDGMTFTTLDTNLEYIYNGNEFDQPHEEGWCEELYPTDYTENISILVQTNNVSYIENPNTRSFRINMYEPNITHTSTVIEDSKKTTLTDGISATDTTIAVDAVNLANFDDYGVVWIGSERIEYGAKDTDNLLFCTRGTLGTSTQEHLPGAVVQHASYTSIIPTAAHFSHYGDNLRMAYNDSGISIADPAGGITPEHAFIRNAAQGSI